MSKNVILPYFLDDQVRDAVLVFPGGAYSYTSPREGKPVVQAFQKEGYHVAVFEYRHEKLIYPEILEEAFSLISEWKKDRRIARIFVCGFSAGGHFALWMLETKPKWFSGGILAYPVVTSNPHYCHQQSIDNLVGDNHSPERIHAVSLERHVKKNMPAVFLWTTMDDQSVPVENSLLLIKALRNKKVPVEVHLFPKGAHGLSLATAETPFMGHDPQKYAQDNQHVSTWFPMALSWMKNIVKQSK